ncbi:hypothetical protein [Moraxella equi]|nr:hypothetical protein [Moraxella equi]
MLKFIIILRTIKEKAMGYPMNSYEALVAITDNKHRNNSHYRELSQQFKLFAVVVHDPVCHMQFDRFINNFFERLDRTTGENFLFFTLAQPSDNWRRRTRNRFYHQPFADAIDQNQSQLDIYGFCQYLNINYNDLPVILLGNNLTFNGFRVIRTNHIHLEQQFESISDFCDNTFELFNQFNDERYLQLIRNINIENDEFYVNQIMSIADALVDLYSFNLNSNQEIFATARDKIRNNINSLKESIRHLDENDEERIIIENRISQYLLFVSTRLANNNENCDELGMHFDTESQLLYRTFNNIMPIIQRFGNGIDSSIGILPITKIFEIETNLSWVQYVRETLGIDMPHYFNRPFLGHGKFSYTPNHINNPRPIDFNHKKEGKFIPPAIGQMALVAEHLLRNNNLPQEFRNMGDFNTFLSNWKTLGNIRNKAMHTQRLGIQDLDRVSSLFANIRQNGFNEILALKRRLMGLSG